jgi:hypothetical protein
VEKTASVREAKQASVPTTREEEGGGGAEEEEGREEKVFSLAKFNGIFPHRIEKPHTEAIIKAKEGKVVPGKGKK